jgi:crossover junction endodeoxyribonuclease RusA
MREVTLELPYPQSINHYKRIGRLVRTKAGKLYQARYNSPDTNAFYLVVASRIRSQGLCGAFKGTNSLEAQLDVYPPDKRHRDLDNVLKIVLDSLQRGLLISDDYLITRLLVNRCVIIPGGKVVVRISELEEKA